MDKDKQRVSLVRIHPIFGIIAAPVLAAGELLCLYSARTLRMGQLIDDQNEERILPPQLSAIL